MLAVAGGSPHVGRMPAIAPVDAIAHNIQLAVAPVFLLSGIGAILNVLTARLGRVIDRARKIEAEIEAMPEAAREAALDLLVVLDRRMVAVQFAVGLCTTSALFVCVVVAILFLGDVLPLNWSPVVATLFVGAMVLLSAGLLLFLHEIRIATNSVRVQRHLIKERPRFFRRQVNRAGRD